MEIPKRMHTEPLIPKMKGELQGEPVILLIDCDAMHNFIAGKVVDELHLIQSGTDEYGTPLGLDYAIKGKEFA